MSVTKDQGILAGELIVTVASLLHNGWVTKGAYDQMMAGGRKSTTNKSFYVGTAVLNLTFMCNFAFSIVEYTSDVDVKAVSDALKMVFSVGVVFSYISIAITIFAQVRRLRIVETVMPLPFSWFKEFLYGVMAIAMTFSSVGLLVINALASYKSEVIVSAGVATIVDHLWPVIFFVI